MLAGCFWLSQIALRADTKARHAGHRVPLSDVLWQLGRRSNYPLKGFRWKLPLRKVARFIDQGLDEAAERGWVRVDMAKDWNRVWND